MILSKSEDTFPAIAKRTSASTSITFASAIIFFSEGGGTKSLYNIDAVIKKLNTIKDGLTSAEKQFKLANDKAQNMSIKRLTKNSPSVAAAFAELEKGDK